MNLQRFWHSILSGRKTLQWFGLAVIMMIGVTAIALLPLSSYSLETSHIRALQPETNQFLLIDPLIGPSPSVPILPDLPEPVVIATAYTPVEEVAPADPSNYGYRYLTDINGNPANNALIVVIHETVGSANSAINTFQTPHPNENDQVSYHSLIRRNGNIVHIVHPQMRAFGAGNSVFDGPSGPETVRTHPSLPGSVNNFAYHTSLESPSDGRGNQSSHSGYTDAQYQSLAWLIAHLPVPDQRITTHKAIDRSGTRRDPRSFDGEKFLRFLHGYNRPY